MKTQRLPQILKAEKYAVFVLLLVICFWIAFGYFSLAQHWGLKTQLNDLGNMAQPLWNTLNGRFMENSNLPDLPFERLSRFGGHANYIFVFLIPLYWLWSDPIVLLLVQVCMVGIAIIPIYLLGRHLFGKNSWLSVVAPILFVLNPMLQDAVLYDMHAIVLALPFLLFSIYFLEKKQFKCFLISAILLIISKEDMSLVLCVIGGWYALKSRNYKVGITIVATSLIYFVLVLRVFTPFFRAGQTEYFISDRYGHLGGSVFEIVKSGITRPYLLVDDFNSKAGFKYLHFLFLGFSYVPLLSGLSLAAIPSVLINVLSSNEITSKPFGYYYLATSVGILSVSTIYALKHWQDKKGYGGVNVKTLVISSMMIGAVNSWFYSPLPYSRVSSWKEFTPDLRQNTLSEIKQLIPADASLSVQNNLGPHFINREQIIKFPHRLDSSQFVLIDVTDVYPVLRLSPRQRNFVHLTQLYPQKYIDTVTELFENQDLGVVYFENGFILFEQKAPRSLNAEAFEYFVDRAKVLFHPYEEYDDIQYPEI